MKTSTEIRDKFRELVDATRRGVSAFRTPPDKAAGTPAPDPAALLAAELFEWASRQEGERFLEFLAERIYDANVQAHAHAGTTTGAYWLGIEAGQRMIFAEMTRWRGELSGNPPVSPRGGQNAG